MTYEQKKVILRYFLYLLIFLFIISIFLKTWLLTGIFLFMLIALISYYIYILKIKETTLCLIVNDDQVLMMLRNKKDNDVHLNKYNGLGGKLEKGESKIECMLREVYEEAGINLTKYNYVGKVTFKNFGYQKGTEVMYCFVGYKYENEIGYCNEGKLKWIDKDKILSLPLWDGDQYFIMKIIENKPFNIYLHYESDKVIGYKIRKRRI